MLSSAFEASRRNRTFLRAVDETLAGRGDRIKAYVIGTNVLQRDEAFDPQSDPIVRIEASRLWRSLERYYLLARQDDPIRIDIPKWGYVPWFQRLRSIWDKDTSPEGVPGPELPERAADYRRTSRDTDQIRRTFSPSGASLLGPWAAVALDPVPIALAVGLLAWDGETGPEAIVPAAAATALRSSCCRSTISAMSPRQPTLPEASRRNSLLVSRSSKSFVYARETGAHYGCATSSIAYLEPVASYKALSERLRDASV
jgi:hypothetical protein